MTDLYKLENELKNLYWVISNKAYSTIDQDEVIRLQRTGKLILDTIDKLKQQAELIDDLRLLNKLKD